MGWAKYHEDNLELLHDRQYMQDTPRYKPATRTICIVEKKAEPDVFYDKLLRCKGCGRQFRYSASAQKVFKEKGWAPPKESKCCRDTNTVSYLAQPAF